LSENLIRVANIFEIKILKIGKITPLVMQAKTPQAKRHFLSLA
jgi:hypothetical protein